MTKNQMLASGGILILIVAGSIYVNHSVNSVPAVATSTASVASTTQSNSVGSTTKSPQDAAFVVSTYVPAGWQVTATDTVEYIVHSPDYMLADAAGTCHGPEGYCEPEMSRGASFTIAYDPCPADSPSADQIQWNTQQSSIDGYVDKQTITVAGYQTELYHSQLTTDSASPVSLEEYTAFVTNGNACREIDYEYIPSSKINYQSELQRFLQSVTAS